MEKKSKKIIGKNWLILIGVIMVVAAIVLLLWFLLKGETKITGNWTGTTTTESLSCTVQNVEYNFFKSDSSLSNTTKINVIFSNGKADSISLVRKATYEDAKIAKSQSDAHIADMNFSFADSGMEPFALNAAYDANGNTDQMSLYVTANEINNASIKYFMLNILQQNIDDYEDKYTSQGFICEIVKNN